MLKGRKARNFTQSGCDIDETTTIWMNKKGTARND